MASIAYALSIQHFINSVGAKAGFASIIGLALLVLLFFTQSRETANLRRRADEAEQQLYQLQLYVDHLSRQRSQQAAARADDRRSRSRPARRRPGRAGGVRRRAPSPASRSPAGARGHASRPPPRASAPPRSAPPRASSRSSSPMRSRSGRCKTSTNGDGDGHVSDATVATPPPAPPPGPAPSTPAGGGNGVARPPVGPHAHAWARPVESTPPPRVALPRQQRPPAAPPPPRAAADASRAAQPPHQPRVLRAGRHPDRRRGRGRAGVRDRVEQQQLVVVELVVGDSSSASSASTTAAKTARAPSSARRATATVTPSAVTVAVLNGTSTNHLAADVLGKLTTAGYKGGTTAERVRDRRHLHDRRLHRRRALRNDALAVAKSLNLGPASVQAVSQGDRAKVCGAPPRVRRRSSSRRAPIWPQTG